MSQEKIEQVKKYLGSLRSANHRLDETEKGFEFFRVEEELEDKLIAWVDENDEYGVFVVINGDHDFVFDTSMLNRVCNSVKCPHMWDFESELNINVEGAENE